MAGSAEYFTSYNDITVHELMLKVCVPYQAQWRSNIHELFDWGYSKRACAAIQCSLPAFCAPDRTCVPAHITRTPMCTYVAHKHTRTHAHAHTHARDRPRTLAYLNALGNVELEGNPHITLYNRRMSTCIRKPYSHMLAHTYPHPHPPTQTYTHTHTHTHMHTQDRPRTLAYLNALGNVELEGKTVLDVGCGTGILSMYVHVLMCVSVLLARCGWRFMCVCAYVRGCVCVCMCVRVDGSGRVGG